jgi:hypothetical protein
VAGGLADLPHLPDTLEGDAHTLDLALATTVVEGWAIAARAKAIAQLYTRTLAEHQKAHTARASHGYDNQAFTRSEVAANISLEFGISLTAADAEVRFALALARHPDLHLALASGRISAPQARAVTAEIAGIGKQWVRTHVVERLVGDPQDATQRALLVSELRRAGVAVRSLPAARLRAIIRREAAALDPDSVLERVRRATERRYVRYYGGPDNTAELVLHGPSDALAVVMARLEATVDAVQSAGEHGTRDQLRFDIVTGTQTDGLVGLLVTTSHRAQKRKGDGPPPRGRNVRVAPPRNSILVNITVPDTTMAGGNEPGVLHAPDGDSPLPAEVARALAFNPDAAIWRQVRCDPTTGQATAVSKTYRPSQALIDYVRYRDGYRSRFPTSTARRCELDHVVEFDHVVPERGGRTDSRNVASEGLHEHRLKTDRGFFISGDADGCLTFRTRIGRTYYSWPHQHMRTMADAQASAVTQPVSKVGRPHDYGDPPF